MKVITETGIYDECAIITELTDAQFELVRENSNYYLDAELVQELNSGGGDIALITFLTIKDDTKKLLQGLHRLFKDYKSVCWWSREHKKFYVRNRP